MRRGIASVLIFFLLSISFGHAQQNFPGWLTELYRTDSAAQLSGVGSPAIFAPQSMKMLFFRQLNDSASYCIYRADNGICLNYYLATQRKRKPNANILIGDNCTADIFSPYFFTTSFLLDSLNHAVTCTRFSENVKDKFLTDDGQLKRFKPGYTRQNAEMERDTVVKQIKISDRGLLEEFKILKN